MDPLRRSATDDRAGVQPPQPTVDTDARPTPRRASKSSHKNQQKKIKQALPLSEERSAYLASFPERNPNPIVEVNLAGQVRYMNPAALRLFPKLKKQRTSHAWLCDWKALTEIFRQGQTTELGRDVAVGDRWYEQSLYYLLPEDIVRIYGHEITKRKRALEALSISEERYRTIVETAAEGIILAEPDGKYIYINQQMANMLGYPVEEILGKSGLDFMYDDEHLQIKRLRNGLRKGDILHGEFKFRRKDGSILWSMYNASPMFNDRGDHIANISMHTDITQHKQAEEALRVSEHQLNQAQTLAHLGSWELDLINNKLTWSDEVYRIFGLKPQEFAATYEAFLENVHPDDRVAVDKAYTSSVQQGLDAYEIEHRVLNKRSGEVRIVYEKCRNHRDASGRVIRSDGMVHDITERKLAEQALIQTRDELEHRVQKRTGELNIANSQLRTEVAERIKAQSELEMNVQELRVIEEELRNNNEMLQDAQKVLDSERQRYQDLFDFAPDGYLVTDLSGIIREANQNATNLLSLSPRYLIGKPLLVFVDREERSAFEHLLFTLSHQPGVQSVELKLAPRHGPSITTAVTAAAATDSSGEDTLRWTIRNITERKRAEEIIRQNLLRNTVLSEVSLSLAEVGLDEKAILDVVVRTTARLIGDSCVITMAYKDGQFLEPVAWYHSKPDALDLMRILYSETSPSATAGPAGKVYQSSRPLLISDMDIPDETVEVSPAYRKYVSSVGISSLLIVPLQVGNRTIGTMGLTRDAAGPAYTRDDQDLVEILANRTAQTIHNARLYQELQNSLHQELETHDQLVRSEKFGAVGRLLASITHEINNPLQTIKNCLYLSREDSDANSPLGEYLRIAAAETDRLSNLVAQLREIYRPPAQGQSHPIDLPALLDEVHSLLMGYLQEKRVRWIVTPPEDGLLAQLKINGVPDQLKQVFLNIALNAIDAMEPNGGSIIINHKLSEQDSQVGICFRDTGPGLPQEVKAKLFEPFTTTKEKGLGLGLVICFDIIQKHHGRIEVESEPGEGAAFTIWLPANQIS